MRVLALVAALATLAALATFAAASGAKEMTYVTCTASLDCVASTTNPGPVADAAVAHGWFADEAETTGWGRLYVSAHSSKNPALDPVAAYAAGWLEGYLTAARIGELWTNFMPGQFGAAGPSPHLFPYINESAIWTTQLVESVNYAAPSSDSEWQYTAQVGLVVAQVDGLMSGYAAAQAAAVPPTMANGAPLPDLSILDMWVLNSIGDLDDLVPAMRVLFPDSDARGMASEGVDLSPRRLAEIEAGQHCSLFAKVVPGEGIVAAHEMWASYWQMGLMYKDVHLDVTLESTASKHVAFSSYPGFVSSEDDFYLTQAGLQVMETTNSVLNVSIYHAISPKSLFSWVRVVVANRMASSGPEWAAVFERHNSGTYNNQWNVINHAIVPISGSPLPDNAHIIVSQMPGVIKTRDVTPILRTQSYFPSYNVPLIPELFDLAGYPSAVATYGDVWSYDKCPRANIFRAKQAAVSSVADVRSLMRYNDYQNDPFSLGCPVFGLAARADLSPPHAKHEWGGICGHQAFGAINGKVSSTALIRDAAAYIIAGPTHQTEPVFVWSSSAFDNVTHVGQPDAFDFDWMLIGGALLIH